MRLRPDFRRFGHKVISCGVKNGMLDKIVSRQSDGLFFLQHVSLTLFHLCPRRNLAKHF